MDNDRIAGAANHTEGKVESAFGRAPGDVASEASRRAREASGLAQNVTRDAGEVATHITKDAMDTGTEYYREVSRALTSTVQEPPLGSLRVAGAVGFMMALVLNRPPPRRPFRDYYHR
jgi:uncharacterized protein YjbJ (UPF0337 family)